MHSLRMGAVLCSIALLAGGCHGARGSRGPISPADSGPAETPDSGTTTPDPDAGEPPPPECTDDCTGSEAPRCAGAGFQVCVVGLDGCHHWSEITPCGEGATCSGGVCMGTSCVPRCDGTICGAGSDGCGGDCGCGSMMVCSDARSCCTPENGAASCNRIVGAYCDRVIRCCTAPGAPACDTWTATTTSCRAHLLEMGLDCSDSSWTSMTYCAEGVDVCVGDIPLIACSDIYGGTVTLPRSCTGG